MTSAAVTQQLATYTLVWSAAFLVLRFVIFRRFSATFSNVVVSWGHAVVAMLICAPAIDWAHPFSNYGGVTSPAQLNALTISLAYFIYDSIACELIEHDLPNLLHHLATILGLCVGVFQRFSGPELCVCLVLMELSSPCLHSRTIFKELGMKDTGIAFANDMAFGLTFMFCRLLVGPFVVYHCLTSTTSSNVVKVGATGIQVVSLFWAWQIVSVIRHKAKKRKAAAKKDT